MTPRLFAVSLLVLQLMTLVIIVVASVIGWMRQPSWHSIARLIGSSLVTLQITVTIMTMLLVTVNPILHMKWSVIASFFALGGFILFAIGYFADMISRHKSKKTQNQKIDPTIKGQSF